MASGIEDSPDTVRPQRRPLVLFVHGMGRSPLSGWLLMRQLRHAGFGTSSFGYWVSRESFVQITDRLAARIDGLLAQHDLVLVGHSLGGVMLRHALGRLGASARRARHLFLLGSPVVPSKMALGLRRNPVFRFATRDCGQLLGSPERMSAIPVPAVPTTGIAGVNRPAAFAASPRPSRPSAPTTKERRA